MIRFWQLLAVEGEASSGRSRQSLCKGVLAESDSDSAPSPKSVGDEVEKLNLAAEEERALGVVQSSDGDSSKNPKDVDEEDLALGVVQSSGGDSSKNPKDDDEENPALGVGHMPKASS